MNNLIDILKDELTESLSNKILSELKLTSLKKSFSNIHFPKNDIDLAKARFRLKFEELFFIQVQLLKRHRDNKTKIKGYEFSQVGNLFNTYYKNHLPLQQVSHHFFLLREVEHNML